MKRFIAFFLVLVMSVCLFSACNTEKDPEQPKDPEEQQEVKDFGKIFYVAVDGNDENEGTKESPLATLGGAVAKVREYKAANGLPEGGIKVEFAAGTYKVTQQTDLTAEDSGEDGKPIVYAAADGAEVIFDGGVSLNASDFKPANDEFKALLQTEEAKANVLEIDLAAAGIWDADDSLIYSGKIIQTLYVNDKIQTTAKWPNEGYYKPESVTANAYSDENGVSYGYISIPQEKADLWSENEHLRFFGYPVYDWSSSTIYDIGLNTESPIILIPMNQSSYGLDKNCHFYIFNVAQELDMPGEYYWDVAAKKLYYWPEDGFDSAKISFTQFVDKVISITDTDYVTFYGLSFENLRYTAISAESSTNSDHVTVSNCLFRCIAKYPVILMGSYNTVCENELYNLGSGGIWARGGDIEKQIPSETLITNNLIHGFSQIDTVYTPAVRTTGLGFVISHNEIYDSPHEAIEMASGMTIIEYNDIHDVCKETSDAGAIYGGRRWDWGSNEIRYNYVHDVIDVVLGGRPNGIYLDDSIAFQHVYGNILVNIGGVGITGGGVANCRIENNVVCKAKVHSFYNNNNAIGSLCWATVYPDGSIWNIIRPYMKTDLWRYTYPSLWTMVENGEVHNAATSPIINIGGFPGFNFWVNNVVYGCDSAWYVIYKGHEETIVITCGTNEYEASTIGNNTEYFDSDLKDVFVDAENGNFFLKEDSKVYRDIIGFEKWDYSLIGIQK